MAFQEIDGHIQTLKQGLYMPRKSVNNLEILIPNLQLIESPK